MKSKIKFYNTLTGKKEEFEPVDPKNVRMYACGPTVYDRAHLGNARSSTIYDVLFRLLREVYGEKNVTYVRNITDVDDKINKASKERKIPIQDLTKEMTKHYHDDMDAIGNLNPTIEPKATENIDEIIKIISSLIDNRHAYVSEGHVLFDVSSYKDYGKLSGRNLDEMIAGSRVEVASYKRNPADFVLWKPASENDDESSVFDSPWSKGRPGWHIECSALSHKYLGDTFDIHGGGVDLKFPHHENEVAQSVCAFKGSKFAKFWIHNGFLMVEGEKMSKSLGNFTTVRELLDEGIEGVVIRLVLLHTHYRKPLDFTKSSLDEAKKVLLGWHALVSTAEVDSEVPTEIIESLSDDLNTPKAIATLHDFKSNNQLEKLKSGMIFLGLYDSDFINKIQSDEKDLSGLGIDEQEILEKIEFRTKAKEEKNWAEADKIRDELKAKGITLKDGPNGVDWFVDKNQRV